MHDWATRQGGFWKCSKCGAEVPYAGTPSPDEGIDWCQISEFDDRMGLKMRPSVSLSCDEVQVIVVMES